MHDEDLGKSASKKGKKKKEKKKDRDIRENINIAPDAAVDVAMDVDAGIPEKKAKKRKSSVASQVESEAEMKENADHAAAFTQEERPVKMVTFGGLPELGQSLQDDAQPTRPNKRSRTLEAEDGATATNAPSSSFSSPLARKREGLSDIDETRQSAVLEALRRRMEKIRLARREFCQKLESKVHLLSALRKKLIQPPSGTLTAAIGSGERGPPAVRTDTTLKDIISRMTPIISNDANANGVNAPMPKQSPRSRVPTSRPKVGHSNSIGSLSVRLVDVGYILLDDWNVMVYVKIANQSRYRV